jgi:thiamine-phosphate pyrophosphorylase
MSTSQPQAVIRRRLATAARLARAARRNVAARLPPAFFLTDPARSPDVARVIERLPRGFGVIWRHFGAPDRVETGRRLARACRRRGLILLVSGDPALALAIGARGVHWPEDRLKGVRLRPAGLIETAAAHSGRAVRRAARLGVDAVLLSAVFPSQSTRAGRPMGAVRFRQLARKAPLPVFALGGINAANAASVMHHAAGWAAIEGVLEAWGRPASA